MNLKQFEVIAKLIRSREPAKTGAKLVLIDQLRVKDAAEHCGLLSQSVTQTVTRFKEAEKLILTAFKSED